MEGRLLSDLYRSVAKNRIHSSCFMQKGFISGIHVAHRTVERAEEADSELKCPKHLLRDTKEPDRQGSRGLFCSWRLLPQLGTWLWRPWYCPDQEAALISGPQPPLTIAGPAATSTAARTHTVPALTLGKPVMGSWGLCSHHDRTADAPRVA